MTRLEDALAKPTPDAPIPAPRGPLTAEVRAHGQTAEVINSPDRTDAEGHEALRTAGLDPAEWTAKAYRTSEWTMANGEQGCSVRWSFERKPDERPSPPGPPLDDLLAAIAHRPAVVAADVTDGEYGYLVALGDMQFGKALADETPILTTDGWRTHGEIRPGMSVYGPNGRPVRVLAVTGSTEQDLYTVEFDRGVTVRATGDHGWQGIRRFHPGGYKRGGPTWEWRDVLLTTDQLAALPPNRPLNVPLAQPVELPDQPLPVDPYLLGLWLGDGSSHTGIISLDARDADAILHLGPRVPSNERGNLVSVRVTGLSTRLAALGLLRNKHVPGAYLHGSVAQRLALLQGLMDTDGSCALSGVAEFSNTNPALTDAVKWLLSSLGFKYTASKAVGRLNGAEHAPYERIHFPTRTAMPVFRFARKAGRQRTAAQEQTALRQVRRVAPAGRGVAQCLTVEGGLYLAGRELVVTHNCDGDGVEGTLRRTLDCLDQARAKLDVYDELYGIGHVHVAWLGDHIEGFVSQGGANVWRTPLTLNEQIRLTRRVMLHAVQLFADAGIRKVTMAAVPGNHGEPQRFSGKGVTRYDDSHDTEALIAVAEAASIDPARFGHVRFYVPETDELTVTLDVAGTTVSHVHGNQWRPGQHMKWWRGQAFNPGSALGSADLLLAGHLHSFFVDTDGRRMFLQTPALEAESVWWRHATGTGGDPGIVVAVTRNGETPVLEVVRSAAVAEGIPIGG